MPWNSSGSVIFSILKEGLRISDGILTLDNCLIEKEFPFLNTMADLSWFAEISIPACGLLLGKKFIMFLPGS
jgi:hypothetical protein